MLHSIVLEPAIFRACQEMQSANMFIVWLGSFTIAALVLAPGLAASKIVPREHSLVIAMGLAYLVPLALAAVGRNNAWIRETLIPKYWLCCVGSGLALIALAIVRYVIS